MTANLGKLRLTIIKALTRRRAWETPYEKDKFAKNSVFQLRMSPITAASATVILTIAFADVSHHWGLDAHKCGRKTTYNRRN